MDWERALYTCALHLRVIPTPPFPRSRAYIYIYIFFTALLGAPLVIYNINL